MDETAPSTEVATEVETQVDTKVQTLPKENITKASPKGVVPTPKITPVKIKGAEFKSEDDAWAEIERGRQSGKLLTEAQKRLETSLRKEKEHEARLKAVKSDYNKAAEALGLTHEEAVDLFSRYLYDKEVAPQKLSPEALRAKQLDEENKKLKAERDTRVKAEQKQEFDKQVAQESLRLRQELEGLIKERKIPGTRIAVKRLASYLASYQEAGVSVPAARAADMLMADYKQEFGELMDEASPEQLEEFLGKERMQKLARNISKWAISKLKGAAPKPVEDAVKDITKNGTGKKKLTPGDFDKFMGGIGNAS